MESLDGQRRFVSSLILFVSGLGLIHSSVIPQPHAGGRQLFFGIYILMHLLVIALGFLHYSLKDNSVGARAIFGVTFRELLLICTPTI